MADETKTNADATPSSPAPASTQTEKPSVTPEKGLEITAQLMKSGFVQFVSMLPVVGPVVSEIISKVVEYIDGIEKEVAAKGQGKWKKQIVENYTINFIANELQIQGFKIVLGWFVPKLIDMIVDLKNKFGWNWIPITN